MTSADHNEQDFPSKIWGETSNSLQLQITEFDADFLFSFRCKAHSTQSNPTRAKPTRARIRNSCQSLAVIVIASNTIAAGGCWLYSLFFWKSCDSSSAETDFSCCRQVNRTNVKPTAQIVFPLSGHLVRDFRCVLMLHLQFVLLLLLLLPVCLGQYVVCMAGVSVSSVFVGIPLVGNKSCMAVILSCLRCVVPNARPSRHLCGKLQFDQSVKETSESIQVLPRSTECCSLPVCSWQLAVWVSAFLRFWPGANKHASPCYGRSAISASAVGFNEAPMYSWPIKRAFPPTFTNACPCESDQVRSIA